MTEAYKKFILKQIPDYSKRLLKLEKDIYENNLENYDIKPMEWLKNCFRIRIWDFRIIFEKSENWNKILKVNKRWNVYKK